MEKNIFIAFILNLGFSIFEFFGGLISGSVAILSDSVHDLGDALSIGISFLLEKKSNRQPDIKYTYGYKRFSVLGGFITNAILIFGSVGIIINGVNRFFYPKEINYNLMIVFALIGGAVNFVAALVTHKGKSINQRAVNLHMLEDVLGWIAVLIGGTVMKLTGFYYLDSVLSILVAVFILTSTVKEMKKIVDLFLMKAPISETEIKEALKNEVIDVHHVHIFSLDGTDIYASMHIVTHKDFYEAKAKVKHILERMGIQHITVETEAESEKCLDIVCKTEKNGHSHHHH